jgi:hypothetical protein
VVVVATAKALCGLNVALLAPGLLDTQVCRHQYFSTSKASKAVVLTSVL